MAEGLCAFSVRYRQGIRHQREGACKGDLRWCALYGFIYQVRQSPPTATTRSEHDRHCTRNSVRGRSQSCANARLMPVIDATPIAEAQSRRRCPPNFPASRSWTAPPFLPYADYTSTDV